MNPFATLIQLVVDYIIAQHPDRVAAYLAANPAIQEQVVVSTAVAVMDNVAAISALTPEMKAAIDAAVDPAP